MSTPEYDSSLKVEVRSIDYIPAAERQGQAPSLFTIWFGSNVQITTIVTGALGVILGLTLPWAMLALLIGNLVGGVFMALHSAQGPRLGIPQMIQSRAQFGFYGAILPLILVVLMYLGYYATSDVLGGQAVSGATGWNVDLSIILVSIVCAFLALFGYRLIHVAERWFSLIAGLGFAYLTYRLFATHDLGAVWHNGPVPAGTFILVIAIAATWQITYCPYVADYSRYLPKHTSFLSTFWWTYSGSVLGTLWMMWFGAAAVAVASKAFNGGSVSFVVGLSQGAFGLFFFIIIIGVIATDVLNIYGCFMSTATTLTAVRRHVIRPASRAVYVLAAAIVGTLLALLGKGNFLNNYSNFILFLAYFLIPWTSINLVDFYFVRKERYDIGAIFDPKGIYGAVNWRTIAAYLIAILVEIPFMSTTFYTGLMVSKLGGADISWILGIIVSAGLYYLLMRPLRDKIEADAAHGEISMALLDGVGVTPEVAPGQTAGETS